MKLTSTYKAPHGTENREHRLTVCVRLGGRLFKYIVHLSSFHSCSGGRGGTDVNCLISQRQCKGDDVLKTSHILVVALPEKQPVGGPLETSKLSTNSVRLSVLTLKETSQCVENTQRIDKQAIRCAN